MKNLQFLQKRPKKRYKNIKLGYIEEEGGDTKFKLKNRTIKVHQRKAEI